MIDMLASSPRRSHLHEAARQSIIRMEDKRMSRWRGFKEPLRLMLQIFQDLSDKNEDFWFRATPFFTRREYVAGTVLFRRNEPAEGFYMIEQGILRAEYDLLKVGSARASSPVPPAASCRSLARLAGQQQRWLSGTAWCG